MNRLSIKKGHRNDLAAFYKNFCCVGFFSDAEFCFCPDGSPEPSLYEVQEVHLHR